MIFIIIIFRKLLSYCINHKNQKKGVGNFVKIE